MKIGVFDSGIGGKPVAEAISRTLPDQEVIFRNDIQHLPYGTKSPKEIQGYVVPILQELVDEGCKVIVIACNTVTTNLIEPLRQIIKVPLVAIEPMVKPAAQMTKTGVITVCATPTTLSSPRYKWLKDNYAKGVKIIEPDCSQWTSWIEENALEREQIEKPIIDACNEGADVIVLGCTHYHWIEELIKEISAGKATVIQPEKPLIEQLKRVLAQLA